MFALLVTWAAGLLFLVLWWVAYDSWGIWRDWSRCRSLEDRED